MGMLAVAGMLSGMGEAAGRAAHQYANVVGASQLQKERNDLEMQRQALMEERADAREARSQAFQRGLQQERLGADMLNRTLEREHADRTLDKTQGFTAGENEKTRGQHREDQAQALSIAKATLAQGDARLANDKEHQAATVKLAQAQLDAAKDKATLQPLADGTFMRVNAQGDVLGRAMDPDTHKPLQGTKDLPATTKLLVDINKTMIQFKGEQLKNPSLLPDERSVINADIDHLKQNVEHLLGFAPEKKGPVEIIDPAAKKPDATETTIAKPPPTPAPGAEEYLAQLRQQADQRAAALKSNTQQQGQAAMEAGSPPASGTQTAAMPRELPRAAAPSGMLAKVDPMQQFASDQPANVPRELDRATPQPAAPIAKEPEIVDPKQAELQARTTPGQPGATFPLTGQEPKGMLARVQEPPITDPNGPTVEPDPLDLDGKQASAEASPPGLRPAANPVRKPLSESDLKKLLTPEQKEAIVNMQRRVRSDGTKIKPATEQALQGLLVKIYGPILQQSGYTPAELVENIDSLMDTLLPERKNRKDRK